MFNFIKSWERKRKKHGNIENHEIFNYNLPIVFGTDRQTDGQSIIAGKTLACGQNLKHILIIHTSFNCYVRLNSFYSQEEKLMCWE